MLVSLIIHKFTLFFLAVVSLELTSNDSVSHASEYRRYRVHAHVGNQQHAYVHHRCVKHSQVALRLDHALLADINEAHKQVGSWNAHMIELGPAIVFSWVPELRTKVSGFNAFKMLVRLKVSQLH